MIKSLFNHEHNAEIIARIESLRSNSPAQWGKMNVAQMLTHCQQPLRVAFGELKLKRGLIGILFGGWAKRKLSSDKPWDKNMPTDKNFIIPDQRDFATEQQKLIAIVRRFAETGPGGITKDPHPFFGKLSPEEWDRLQWNHLDHHLRQFGV